MIINNQALYTLFQVTCLCQTIYQKTTTIKNELEKKAYQLLSTIVEAAIVNFGEMAQNPQNFPRPGKIPQCFPEIPL